MCHNERNKSKIIPSQSIYSKSSAAVKCFEAKNIPKRQILCGMLRHFNLYKYLNTQVTFYSLYSNLWTWNILNNFKAVVDHQAFSFYLLKMRLFKFKFLKLHKNTIKTIFIVIRNVYLLIYFTSLNNIFVHVSGKFWQ